MNAKTFLVGSITQAFALISATLLYKALYVSDIGIAFFGVNFTSSTPYFSLTDETYKYNQRIYNLIFLYYAFNLLIMTLCHVYIINKSKMDIKYIKKNRYLLYISAFFYIIAIAAHFLGFGKMTSFGQAMYSRDFYEGEIGYRLTVVFSYIICHAMFCIFFYKGKKYGAFD
jgi:hypothetical protein